MKKLFSVVLMLLGFVVANAQPPDVPAEKGAKFGAEITAADEAMAVDAMVAKVTEAGEGKKTEVKIKAEVLEVCQQMGCWIRIKNGDEKITVKMKGHKWFVPSALAGKTIIIDGTASLKMVSVDDQKHLLEDAGKSKEEVEAIKEPKREVVVEARGILVV